MGVFRLLAQVEKYLVNVSEAEKLSFFKRAVSVLESNDVEYWLVFGTLLGCMRDKGFIPWDSDIDLGVSDFDSVLSLEERFASVDIKVVPFFEKGHSRSIHLRDLRLLVNASMHIDIYEFTSLQGHLVFRWAVRPNAFVRFIDMFVYVFSCCDYIKTGLFPLDLIHAGMRFFSLIPKRVHSVIKSMLEDFLFMILCKRMIMFPESKPELMFVSFYDVSVPIPIKWEDHLMLVFGEGWNIPDDSYNDRKNSLVQRIIDGYEVVALDSATASNLVDGDIHTVLGGI